MTDYDGEDCVVMLRKCLALAVLIAALSVPAFADGGKVEATGAFADPSASESVRNALEPKGYRVSLADGVVLCDVWLRNGAPIRAKTDVSGAIYTELADSTLIGVVSFPAATKDYRGQVIKPGAYTLRYELHPTDGNHMGISSFRDFLLLTSVALDQTVDTVFKFEELTKLSAKSSGTNHPLPWSLVLVEGEKSFPSVMENEAGHLVLFAKLKTQGGGELPIAIVVKGVAEQ